jgi:outer membrane lipoprotein LolB
MRLIRSFAGRLACSGAIVLALLLAGCASAPPVDRAGPARESLAAFALEARFALRHENTNYSGRLSWRHEGADDALLLSSPFGQGIAQIESASSGARLTMSDGKSYVARDTEALTQQFLGYPLPLQRLVDWVRARSSGGEVEARDAIGRPLRLHHEDWRIAYDYEGENADALPIVIFAQRADGFELRLRIDSWTSLP